MPKCALNRARLSGRGSNPLVPILRPVHNANHEQHHGNLDQHPDHGNVWLAGGFSGHGFKFTPLMGQIAADLLTNTPVQHNLSRFQLARFQNRSLTEGISRNSF